MALATCINLILRHIGANPTDEPVCVCTLRVLSLTSQTTCSDLVPGGSTYCARYPSGLSAPQSTLPNSPYKDASDAVVSAWRGSGAWFNWFWNVNSYNAEENSFEFGLGGFQGTLLCMTTPLSEQALSLCAV